MRTYRVRCKVGVRVGVRIGVRVGVRVDVWVGAKVRAREEPLACPRQLCVGGVEECAQQPAQCPDGGEGQHLVVDGYSCLVLELVFAPI